MKAQPTIKLTTAAYRVLGLPMGASLKECRVARNRLIQKFHPDKHAAQDNPQGIRYEDQVHHVQEAFTYLRDNFKAIEAMLKELKGSKLTNQFGSAHKSHWVYSEIQQIKED